MAHCYRFGFMIFVIVFRVQLAPVFGKFNTTETTRETTTEFPSSQAPEPPIEVLTCPQSSTIFPCICLIHLTGIKIECSGSAVNQSTIENAFREIRQINEIPEDCGISISEFELMQTDLTHLDLASFYGSTFDYLSLNRNGALTKLVTSGDPRDYGSINVTSLFLWHSPIKRTGFGDSLKYFSNDMTNFDTDHIFLNDLNNSDEGKSKTETESESEFLPGLSGLINLQYLSTSNCNISGRLNSDTLIPKELQILKCINLSFNNITAIGENFFNFDGDFVHIYLMWNKLNETSIHPNSGIARHGRKTSLNLSFNNITTLPPQIFEVFLDAYPENVLELKGNALICDERLSWIKSRREEFQSRVEDANCSNDEGHNVFDSDLIP